MKDFVFDLDYAGSVTRKYDTSYNINQPAPGPGNVADRRPVAGYSSISMVESSANGSYNSLQSRLERRFSGGLTLTNSYTLQKVMGVGSAGQDPNNRRGDKAPADIDYRHRWALAVVYELPFGTGRRFLGSVPSVVNGILGGWEFGGRSLSAPIPATNHVRNGSRQLPHPPVSLNPTRFYASHRPHPGAIECRSMRPRVPFAKNADQPSGTRSWSSASRIRWLSSSA